MFSTGSLACARRRHRRGRAEARTACPLGQERGGICVHPDDKTFRDTLSSAHEVKARGAKIIGISSLPNDIYDAMMEIPKMNNELLYPLVEILPLQLFSYYLALQHNADPDFPRNLAKSVTVA